MSSASSPSPSKAICSIASRFLLPNLFLTLVLIKFYALKARSAAWKLWRQATNPKPQAINAMVMSPTMQSRENNFTISNLLWIL